MRIGIIVAMDKEFAQLMTLLAAVENIVGTQVVDDTLVGGSRAEIAHEGYYEENSQTEKYDSEDEVSLVVDDIVETNRLAESLARAVGFFLCHCIT